MGDQKEKCSTCMVVRCRNIEINYNYLYVTGFIDDISQMIKQ